MMSQTISLRGNHEPLNSSYTNAIRTNTPNTNQISSKIPPDNQTINAMDIDTNPNSVDKIINRFPNKVKLCKEYDISLKYCYCCHNYHHIAAYPNNTKHDPLTQFISPTLLSMESINTTYIDPSLDQIPLDIIKPYRHQISTIADTGANINAISFTKSNIYSKYIQLEHRPFRVRTGGGYITCQEHIPLSIKTENSNLHSIKFYIIPD